MSFIDAIQLYLFCCASSSFFYMQVVMKEYFDYFWKANFLFSFFFQVDSFLDVLCRLPQYCLFWMITI